MTEQPSPPPVNRRLLLTGGAAALGGALASGAAVAAVTRSDERTPTVETPDAVTASAVDYGTATVPFHGPRQAGVATGPQAYAAFVAFTLGATTDRAALARLLRLLSDDAARLTQGIPALADTEPELAVLPARLTVTFGFGPRLYAVAGLADRRPPSVADLPAFAIDRLEPRWSGGDLLLQICADDPITVAHTQRMLIKDARPFASVRWVQQGFRRGRGVEHEAHTQRNIMGQIDGTGNPKPDTAAFDTAVWVADGPEWHRDGSTLVVRRIRTEMETWDKLGRVDKEQVIGRRLDTGAPLTGEKESDIPDFSAVNEVGLPIMPDFSHVTRAHISDDRYKILRRPYNYDGVPGPDGTPDSGLIFAAYQADVAAQFLPIQQRLADHDLLNEWVTPIGSAVFAIPPGCPADGWIGESLLS
ncbi:Dyp-type peroxidase [Solwaraspora sp. WMMD406]|uniref:Dyp-type peroxidase n=1 Tax=Solwaraspora sp. WMMD406 TaxID=3016095 RepID=UPI002415F71E|nr:Dyp-type peroxidase [Solwaraspora sp. WMMD406]MDG4766755.1 Dyp-type peroxidase [Solwaraspora sp. WMMD406]